MPDKEKFLSDIQSDNADRRFAAWRAAGEMDADVIPPLGKLVASESPGVAKAAREAIVTLIHSVGKEASGAKRADVVRRLLELAGDGVPLAARALAFRQLSLLAGEDSAPAIAKWIGNADLREEVAFCLERIPGKAAIAAFAAAYKDAPATFKPRILAALGHRRAVEALELVTAAMRSPDKEIAMAATKAFGRIGKKPAAPPRYPDPAGLSEWQKIDRMDSLLRYADATGSIEIYKTALDRPEEHWQCAAIIGLAKLGTAEAAAAIFPKLKSPQRNVRITAAKAWKGMAT